MPEPPIGIEPMTYASRGACSLAPHAFAAPIARAIARAALTVLGLSKDPFHEPFHDRGCCVTRILLLCVTARSLHPRREPADRHKLTVCRC